jgi:hypothetical protein
MKWTLILLLLAGMMGCQKKPEEVEVKVPANDWSFISGRGAKFVALVDRKRQFVYFALFDPERMRYSFSVDDARLRFGLSDGFVEVKPQANVVIIDKDEGRWSATLPAEDSTALVQRLRVPANGTLKLEDLANDLMGRAAPVERTIRSFPTQE